MPRKSPREASQSPASGSRRSSRIASLAKEEATPPRSSKTVAETTKSPSGRTRVRTPVKSPAKASPKTPTSQKRGQKRKSEDNVTPTSKRGRRSARNKEEEVKKDEEEDQEGTDAGPSGDIADGAKESGKDAPAVESGGEEEKMETEEEHKEAPIECPSIKITPPSDDAKPAVVEQVMDTSDVAKKDKAQETSTVQEIEKPAESSPAKTSPAKTSPAKTSPAKTSPAKTSPVKPSPAKTSPAKTSPAKTSPVKSSTVEPDSKANTEEKSTAVKRVVESAKEDTPEEPKDGAVKEAVKEATPVEPEQTKEKTEVKKDEPTVTPVPDPAVLTNETKNPATGESTENDVKAVQETKEPEVTNGQSDVTSDEVKESPKTDTLATQEVIKESSPQKVDSQSSPGVISVGTN